VLVYVPFATVGGKLPACAPSSTDAHKTIISNSSSCTMDDDNMGSGSPDVHPGIQGGDDDNATILGGCV
jgi:hypothetical protein